MNTSVLIRADRPIADVQKDFAAVYPFLKIDFFRINHKTRQITAERLEKKKTLEAAGLLREGELVLNDTMTVQELEQLLRNEFGVFAQVSRKSGRLWLETTITDSWTLKQQNDHGRELSEPLREAWDEFD